MCEFAEFQCLSLTEKRSEEVAWVIELPVGLPISYSYIVQKKIIFKNALILTNIGSSINCTIFDETFNTLAKPLRTL